MFDISLLAVAVAGLVPLLLGMAWYHPKVFGTAWMNIVGITPDMAEKAKSRMFPMMGIALVASLVFAYVLAHFSLAWGVFDWRGGLELGFWIWLGFQVPILLSPVLWDMKPWKLFFINASYQLIAILVMTLVLVLIP